MCCYLESAFYNVVQKLSSINIIFESVNYEENWHYKFTKKKKT